MQLLFQENHLLRIPQTRLLEIILVPLQRLLPLQPLRSPLRSQRRNHHAVIRPRPRYHRLLQPALLHHRQGPLPSHQCGSPAANDGKRRRSDDWSANSNLIWLRNQIHLHHLLSQFWAKKLARIVSSFAPSSSSVSTSSNSASLPQLPPTAGMCIDLTDDSISAANTMRTARTNTPLRATAKSSATSLKKSVLASSMAKSSSNPSCAAGFDKLFGVQRKASVPFSASPSESTSSSPASSSSRESIISVSSFAQVDDSQAPPLSAVDTAASNPKILLDFGGQSIDLLAYLSHPPSVRNQTSSILSKVSFYPDVHITFPLAISDPSMILRSHSCHESCLLVGTIIVGRRFVAASTSSATTSNSSPHQKLLCFRRDKLNPRDPFAVKVFTLDVESSSSSSPLSPLPSLSSSTSTSFSTASEPNNVNLLAGTCLGYLPARLAKVLSTLSSPSDDDNSYLDAIGCIPPGSRSPSSDAPLPIVLHAHINFASALNSLSSLSASSSSLRPAPIRLLADQFDKLRLASIGAAALPSEWKSFVCALPLTRGSDSANQNVSLSASASSSSSIGVVHPEPTLSSSESPSSTISLLFSASDLLSFDQGGAGLQDLCSKQLDLFRASCHHAITNYQHCLNDEERLSLASFTSTLSASAQRLLIRLASRKGPWWHVDKIQYSEIPPSALTELLQHGFMVTADSVIESLTESSSASVVSSSISPTSTFCLPSATWDNPESVYSSCLSTLPLPQLRVFAQKLGATGASGRRHLSSASRDQILQILQKQLSTQKSILSRQPLSHAKSTRKSLRDAAGGDLYALNPAWLKFRERVWLMQGLSPSSAESALTAQELGFSSFYPYSIQFRTPLFATRCALLAYQEACACLEAISVAVAAEDLEATLPLLRTALMQLKLQIPAFDVKNSTLLAVSSSSKSSSSFIDVEADAIVIDDDDYLKDEDFSGSSSSRVSSIFCFSSSSSSSSSSATSALSGPSIDGVGQLESHSRASAGVADKITACASVLAAFSATWKYAECIYQSLKVLERFKLYQAASEIAASVLLPGVPFQDFGHLSHNFPSFDIVASLLQDSSTLFSENSSLQNGLCRCGDGCHAHPDGLALSDEMILKRCSRRGALWNRLLVNLQSHLKMPKAALGVSLVGLNDPLVRTGERVSLCHRAARLFKSLKIESALPAEIITDLVRSTPTRVLKGRPTSRRTGTKSKFFGLNDELCTVEELVIQQFSCEGWKGVHAENGVWMSLLSLLFIDIIFAQHDDAFHAPFQSSPIDFGTDAFYSLRRVAIDERLTAIKDGQAICLLESAFQFHGCRIAGLDWDSFNLAELQEIAQCVGGQHLASLLELLIRDLHFWSGGLPDLLLIRPSSDSLNQQDTCLLVEVKGPRDSLSDQQKAWLILMQHRHIPVMVCHVKEEGVDQRDDDENE